jgi:hypothetical protein
MYKLMTIDGTYIMNGRNWRFMNILNVESWNGESVGIQKTLQKTGRAMYL